MEEVLDRFEGQIQIIGESLSQNATYEQQFDQRDLYKQIGEQQEEIQTIIRELKSRAYVLKQLRRKQLTFIEEHHELPYIKVQELIAPKDITQQKARLWKKILNLNHSLKITIRISQIKAFLRLWGNVENQLSFEKFRIHLHHVDKQATSQYILYDASKGFYHVSALVANKHVKNNEIITLTIQHFIRNHNYLLYSQLFQSQTLTLVAQRDDGYVIGLAQIDISSMTKYEEGHKMPISLKFIRKYQQKFTEEAIFYAKCIFEIESTPIAPEINELNKNYQSQINQRANSRSPSPNRIISVGNKSKEKSPKKKKQLVNKLVNLQQNILSLSVYEFREYKYKLNQINLSASRELIYKKVVNIKEKKVELVRISEEYYFKLFAVKQDSRKEAYFVFSFNQKEYKVHTLANCLYQIITLQEYKIKTKVKSKDNLNVSQSCLIDLGGGNLIYGRQSNRVQKSLNKLELQSGLLCTLFVRSILSECQINCSQPFILIEIVKKEDGFMITYKFLEDVKQEKDKTLVLLLKSEHNQMKEIHVFDCRVQPRKFNRQSLYRQVYFLKGQQFTQLSLKMIVNENNKYEIESADNQKVRVVNGSNFEYRNQINEHLKLQRVGNIPQVTDLLFRDHKNRSFFLRLSLKERQKEDQK